MSQTVITQAFEALKAQEAANGGVLTLDEFVFASVPNLNITDPIDRSEGLPSAEQIVHRQAVSKTGMVNSNAVVYSVVLGADVGDFEFNWVGLLNKASGAVAMIVHAPSQKKIKTASGQQGNVLTRSFLMEYNGASQQTQIITPADTWQIDFTARLGGADERIRQENLDTYGPASFLDDGFKVSGTNGNYQVKKGAAYIEGLRAELLFDQAVAVTSRPSKIWVDVCWRGTLTSVWAVATKITVADTLANYVAGDEQHFVYAIAEIRSDGTVIDLRQASALAQLAGLSKTPLQIYVTDPRFAGGAKPYPYDSSPAINAAITYANTLPGGATVIIPAGVWGIGASGAYEGVILKEKVRLLGVGRGVTTLKLLPAANSTVVSFQKDTTLPIELGDMTVDGSKSEQTITSGGVHGVRFHGNDRIYVHDLEVRNATYYGLGVGYTVGTEKPVADSRFERLEIYGNGRAEDGQGDGFDGKRMRRCSFSDIYVHDNLQRGIDVRGEQNTFDRIYAYNNGATGISARALGVQPASISQETYIAISNSYAVGNADAGFFIANNEPPLTGFKMQVAVTNCWATRNATDGFMARGTDLQVSLASCFAEKNGQQGFRFNSLNSDTSLSGVMTACQARSNTGAGFLVNAGIGPVTLDNCVSEGNAGTYQTAIDSNNATVIGGMVSAAGKYGGLKCTGTQLTVVGGSYVSGSGEGFRVDGENPSISNIKISGDTAATHFRIHSTVTRGSVNGLDVSAVTAGTPFSVPATVTVQGVVGGAILAGISSKVAAGGTHALQAVSTPSPNGPALTVEGPSADIHLLLNPKGAGTVKAGSHMLPTATAAYNLGSSFAVWAGGFMQAPLTITSDEHYKSQPVMLSPGSLDLAMTSDQRQMMDYADTILDAWSEVDFVQYQFLDRIEDKGEDGARWHFGIIAQRAVEAFQRHGLDPFRFAFICYDEWEHSPEITEEFPAEYDGDGELIHEAYTVLVRSEIKAGSKYGIRYEEALILEAACQRRSHQRLLSRIEALEAK